MTRTTCAYCGVGCGVDVAVKDREARIAAVSGDVVHPANLGRLCSKGTALGEVLSPDSRLLRPRAGAREVFWGEALDTVSAKLAQVLRDHGPQAIAFYVSGQLLTEDYYVANKLAKGFLGTANIDTNSRLCMASTVVAQQRAFGEDVVPGCYEDLELADLVVIAGSNMAWCHPVLFQRLAAAREKRGTKVVVIDPRRTATCRIADLHLPIRPGSDSALFNGLLAHLFTSGAIDEGFIALHTAGFSEALTAARGDISDIAALARRCDVPADSLEGFFDLFAATQNTVTCWSQGVNQSSGGTDKVNAIINCHLATGRVGKPGASPFSLTGQPNAMGGREVGGLATQLAAHMALDDASARERVARFWRGDSPADGLPPVPDAPGFKAVELFDRVARGDVKFLWVIGTNPAATLPDAGRVEAALADCEFLVVSDCVATNDTLRHAHVALPAPAWGERDGTVTNSERRISRVRSFLAAPGGVKPDWWAVAQVARRLGHGRQFAYTHAAEIFREHAALTARDNNPLLPRRLFHLGAFADITAADYEALAPVQWPATGVDDAPRSDRLFADGIFCYPDGRARFVAIASHRPAVATGDAFPLVLNTHRLRDQWHTMTRTGFVPRLVRHTDEPRLAMHEADAACHGVVDGSLVRVTSGQGTAVLRACIGGDAVRRGEVAAAMHWTREQAPHSCANVLVNACVDPHSGQPESKHTPVRVQAMEIAVDAIVLVRHRHAGASWPNADYVLRTQEDGCRVFRLALTASPASRSVWLREQITSVLDGVAGHWLAQEDPASGRVAMAFFAGDELVAWASTHAARDAGRMSWLRRMVATGDVGDAQRAWLLGEALPPGEHRCSRQVCACLQVQRDEVVRVLDAGCESVADVIEATRAGSRCGTCLPELACNCTSYGQESISLRLPRWKLAVVTGDLLRVFR